MANADITKNTIAQAMKQLMSQKPLAKISVNDIARSCGINRNSFYYHFKDKYDLVNWIFRTEIDRELGQDMLLHGKSWDILNITCTFLYNDRDFYRNALSVTGQNSFVEYLTQLVAELVRSRASCLFQHSEYLTFYSVCFADAFVATLYRWFTEDMQTPPDKLAELIHGVASGAASHILGLDTDN